MKATATRTAMLGVAFTTVALLLFVSPCYPSPVDQPFDIVPDLIPCLVAPPDIENGSHVEMVEKRTALYNCNPEFWLSGPDTLTCVTLPDGNDTWRPEPAPQCYPIQDCPPIELEKGGYEGDCCAPGDNVTFYCDDPDRYNLLGAEEAICLLNGTWNVQIPTCQDRYCQDPGIGKRSQRSIVLNGREYKRECCPPETKIFYFCEGDYDLEGEKEIHCGYNGTWSHARPLCRPKDACDNFEVSHGRVSGKKSGGDFFTSGDSAFITCDRGFRVNGTDQLYCEEDGQWDDDVPLCIEYNCTRFEPGAHLQVDEFRDSNKTAFTEGTFINFRCDDGYLLEGAFSTVCRNGDWLGRMPKCQQIHCGTLRGPEHGWISGNSTDVGATASFGCFQGYVLLGSSERQCDFDGQWDGEPARCVTKVTAESGDREGCLDPGTPDNGFVVGRSQFFVGDNVTYACKLGYHIRGDAVITCEKNGKWSSSLPRCVGKFYYDKVPFLGEVVNSMTDEIPAQNSSAENESGASSRALYVREPNSARYFVYFLFDASTSIGPRNFKTGIKLAKAITRKVKVTRNGHRVGAIVFTKDAKLVIDPTQISDQDLVLKKLDEINHTSGGTSISNALKKLTTNVASAKATTGGKIKLAAFLISDGKANIGGDAYTEAKNLKDSQVEIYSIGITGQRDDGALNRLATKPENVFVLRDYDALQWLADILTNGTIDYSQCGLSFSHDPKTGFDVDDSTNSTAVARILGGDTVRTVWPWMVQIQVKQRNKKFEAICGATIIDRRWILTAAHCLHAPRENNIEPLRYYTADQLQLRAGFITSDKNARTFVIESIVIHEDYNSSTQVNDIALIKLKQAIVYEKAVRPICLPHPQERDHQGPNEDTTVFSIGWGAVKSGSLTPSSDLKQLEMKIVSPSECRKKAKDYKEKVFPRQGLICASSDKGDTCKGDSGGPLMEGVKDEENIWTQVGIVSWGNKVCGKNKYSFYTDVAHYVDWISRHVEMEPAHVVNAAAGP